MTPDEAEALLASDAPLPADVLGRARAAIAEGRFGVCAGCGDEIAARALRERPDRGLCEGCSDRLRGERAGRRFGVCGVRGR